MPPETQIPQDVRSPALGNTTSDERTWAMLAHLGPLAMMGFIAPLIILLTKGQESPYVRHHAAQSLNLQITLMIALLPSFILMFVFIGICLIFPLIVTAMVFQIVGAVKAYNGERYVFPVAIPLIH
jgi:uncharacterized Tic20 family protein